MPSRFYAAGLAKNLCKKVGKNSEPRLYSGLTPEANFGGRFGQVTAPAFSGSEETMKYYHWIITVAVVFACIYVWKSDMLKGVPVLGPYLAA